MTTWTQGTSEANLSNGNLTATFQTTPNTWRSVNSTNSPPKASGSGLKLHVECTFTGSDTQGWIFGLTDGTTSLTAFCGSDSHSIGCQPDITTAAVNIYLNSVELPIPATGLATGDVIALEIDVDNELLWMQTSRGGGWSGSDGSQSGNPAAGTLGISFSSITTTGGLRLMGSGFYTSSNPDTLIVNPGVLTSSVAFVVAVSAGFTAWDTTAATTVCQRAMLGVGCGIALARKLEENPILTRRGLLLPRRRPLLIGHNGGPPLDE